MSEARSAEQWLAAVLEAEGRGELLTAVDLAERGLAEHPGDVELRHRAVLALARSGATEVAAERFAEYGLDEIADEDVAALRARIAKDAALADLGDERRERLAEAARAYEAIFERTGGYYPAVNAGTLYLLAGDGARAHLLARSALDSARAGRGHGYFRAATEAEAQLLLGDADGARESLRNAAALADGDHGALATTRRQLRLICEHQGIDDAVLEPLSGPSVAHFCGHRIAAPGESGRLAASAEEAVRAGIEAELDRGCPGYAYGSLAAGADILWAEGLLRRGAELHAVLPFSRDEFVRASVAPSGETWTRRFERCLERAREVTYAADDAYLGDDVLYRYGAELAMGLTLLRGRYLDAEVCQLAVWDGGPAHGDAGTAIDVDTWRSRGLKTTCVTPPGERAGERGASPTPAAAVERGGRVVRALLFGDVKGFSALSDEELPRFAEVVLGTFSTVLDRRSGAVEHRNTWGDAIYAVLTDVPTAAECALELQDEMASIDFAAAELPELALRVGAHVGPGFPTWDPVIEETAFMGSHVSRTARIEPVTPPGSVYVTSAFAAALALSGREDLGCDYVGHMPAAKGFGHLRMYRLRRLG